MINLADRTPVRQKRSLRLSTKENIAGWAFISLNFFGYILFKLIPILMAAGLSFSKWNFATSIANLKFVGLRNYANLWSDSTFLQALLNTVTYGVVLVPVSIFLALILGVLLNKHVYGRGVLRLAFYLPNISSMVAVSMVWMILFLPSYGPINSFLAQIGIADPPKWLNSTHTSLLSIIIVGIWQRIGYNIIIVLAGLQGIPNALYEAAEIDGANKIQQFFRITIPSLSNTMFFLIMISFISSFQVFETVQVMTQGGPGDSSAVLVYYIYRTAFMNNNIGYATAMSWVLFFLVFIFSIARMIFTNIRKREA
jgi:multiple sugar transport system permease protein